MSATQPEMSPSKSKYIEQSNDKMSGKPVFKSTRVPVSYLFEFLEAGDSVNRFFEQYPMNQEGKNNVRGFLRELHEAYD